MRPRLRHLALALPLIVGLGGLAACAPPPTVQTQVVMSGLDIPWDLNFLPSGSMVVTERPGRIQLRTAGGTVRQLTADLSGLFVASEGGLMGIEVDPAFTSNRRLYTCMDHRDPSTGALDVRVIPWTLNTAETALTRLAPIVTGSPVSSGRHSGCRLRFAPDGRLWIGTGDAATGTNPQNLASLGGKVLRVDRMTGDGVSGNPFFSSTNADTRRIWSYGHRNMQGLAINSSGVLFTVEHGSDRDDEVNPGVTGNFGWDPVPGYDESTPMTDLTKFPNAVQPAWASGSPTVATSGAAFLKGNNWGGYNGRLAVACLKASKLQIMQGDGTGKLHIQATLFEGTFGRLRTAQMGPNGKLYLTTSNGGGTDRVIEVTANMAA